MEAVSRETDALLRQYHALLIKWQERINLISPNTVKDAWQRHFVDSLQLLPLIPEEDGTVYDLGSGAGFPGLVLAIARPDLDVTLIESDSKKCAFLQAVSRETGARVKIRNSRIETATVALSPPRIVTARALASLTALFDYIRPWAEANPALTMILPKGGQARAEIEAAQVDGWSFEYAETRSATDAEAKILTISRLVKAAR